MCCKFIVKKNKEGNVEITLSGEHNDVFVLQKETFEEVVKFMMTSDGHRSIIFVDTICTNWCVCDKHDRATKFSEVEFSANTIIISQLSTTKEFRAKVPIPSWII